MIPNVGILGAACHLPAAAYSVSALFTEEDAVVTPDLSTRLGIEAVRLCTDETGSAMALEAAREALDRAGIEAAVVDVIIDYTVLPQEYLVPAWNMSNKLQHELGATGAFTLGFSGGGTSNFHVALKTAAALLQHDPSVRTALLVGADVTIPANRVLNPDLPITVLGDGASALVLQVETPGFHLLDTEIHSSGALHDVCFIPGGALAHPDRPDLYRLRLDTARYRAAPRMERLARMADGVLRRAGLDRADLAGVLYPNISAEDQADLCTTLDLRPERLFADGLARHGHVQANDFVINFVAAQGQNRFRPGDHVLFCSHGMGFMTGVTLMKC